MQSAAALSPNRLAPLTASFAIQLTSPESLRNLLNSHAAVLFVFFSSDSSSLYTRGEPRSSGSANSALGASLTRPADMDALLASTSLVPESPAWEPIFPNAAHFRLVVFPERRKKSLQPLTEPTWLHNPPVTRDYYCCVTSAALVAW
jgi:hypothetical protein